MSYIDTTREVNDVYPEDGVTSYPDTRITVDALIKHLEKQTGINPVFSVKKCDCGVGTKYPAGTPHWITCAVNQPNK